MEKKVNEAARRAWIFLLASLQSAWCRLLRDSGAGWAKAKEQHLIDFSSLEIAECDEIIDQATRQKSKTADTTQSASFHLVQVLV